MERKGYIGSSDIASCMGLSRWKTPYALWAEKTGLIEPDDISDKWQVRVGNKLENAVAEFFTEETGKTVRRSPKIYVHKDYPFLRAQVDRIVTGNDDELLEAKTCSPWKKDEWAGEEIPIEYILQVQFQLLVTGRSVGHIAVLIGNEDFKHKEIKADAELQKKMLSDALAFWKMVEDKTPPMVTSDDADTLLKVFPKETTDAFVEGTNEDDEMIAHKQELEMHVENMKEEVEEIKNKLKQKIAEKVALKTQKYVVTFKQQGCVGKYDKEKMIEDGVFDKYYQSGNTRVLRITLNKEGK